MHLTGFVVVFENEDGSFSPSEHIHSTPMCAIASIPLFEGRKVHCISEIDVILDPNAKSGLLTRIDLKHEIEEFLDYLPGSGIRGFGNVAQELLASE